MAAETIDAVDLAATAQVRYLRYAMSVITSRALPDVRDGLKPGQRRILYAMDRDLHLRPANRPVKSSKVVGHVMGNYHPHGDQAIYDAMVRMGALLEAALRLFLDAGISNVTIDAIAKEAGVGYPTESENVRLVRRETPRPGPTHLSALDPTKESA